MCINENVATILLKKPIITVKYTKTRYTPTQVDACMMILLQVSISSKKSKYIFLNMLS